MNQWTFFNKTIKLTFITAMLMASCTTQKWPGGDQIAVTWELVSNSYSDQAASKAVFTLENLSKVTLTDTNWQLFFNQAPRHVIATNRQQPAMVERINGDWFRLYPLRGFKLSPGQKIRIEYETSWFIIKETDAPVGLYFVFSDETKQEEIVPVSNFTIIPFQRPEQYSRGPNDQNPFPSPQWQHEQNQTLSLVDDSLLLPVIPSPYSIKKGIGTIALGADWEIVAEEELKAEADYLSWMVLHLSGIKPEVRRTPNQTTNFIHLKLGDVVVDGRSKEAYALDVNKDGFIEITGADKPGLFYGVQTLLSLIDPMVGMKKKHEVILPVLRIEDVPRFGHRGVHIDVVRNFHSIETLMRIIDVLAFYKINTLHLHLTDDEGWRLEIAGLPELTQVGGQRGHAGANKTMLPPSYGSGPFPYAENSFGSGFYTRGDYVNLLRYAAERHIRVIPEINMPGHSRAAILAMEARYNNWIKNGNEEEANRYRLIDPNDASVYSSAQLYNDVVVNVARESVYHFYEKVLDEVISIYAEAGAPLEIFHAGGDEVPRGAWTASPMVDEKMKELANIDLHANMHSYFSSRVLELLRQRGLKMAGWEEVALNTLPEGGHVPNPVFAGGDVIPYVWNNLWGAQDLAYRLANRGFPVLLNHVTAFYFDLAYNRDPREPGLYWGGFVDTRNAWYYNPYNVFQTTTHDEMGRLIDRENEYRNMERLKPAAQTNIIGIQAQLWSETIRGQNLLDYYLLPKLLGLAETAWARQRNWETMPENDLRQAEVDRQWNIFANTMARREIPRLSFVYGGYHYRIPPPGAVIFDGMLTASATLPGLQIRYTTDGSEPTADSPLYTEPVRIQRGKVQLASFDMAGRKSRAVVVE